MHATCANGILLTYPSHSLVATPPNHLSTADVTCHWPGIAQEPRRIRPRQAPVIFAPTARSARLCVDEHHNFIGRRMCLPQ